MTRLPADVIPNLAGSVMYRHCVEVYLRHRPGPAGDCACGWPGCRARYNASQVIRAAGVNPAALTAADAAPRPWHERPVGPTSYGGADPTAPPLREARGPTAAVGIAPMPTAVPAAPEGRWGAGRHTAAPHLPTGSDSGPSR